jgi:hypothetical protein
MRSFDGKVNRKARRAALRSVLSAHAQAGTLAVLDPAVFDAPSTKAAADLVDAWGKDAPLLVVAQPEDEALIKSSATSRRDHDSERLGAPLVRAGSPQRARAGDPGRAVGLCPTACSPVVSRRATGLIEPQYSFRVHGRAQPQIRRPSRSSSA